MIHKAILYRSNQTVCKPFTITVIVDTNTLPWEGEGQIYPLKTLILWTGA